MVIQLGTALPITKSKTGITLPPSNELVLWKPVCTAVIGKWGWKNAFQRLETQSWARESYNTLNNIDKQKRKEISIP